MWQPSQLRSYEYLLALNPFFSMLEIVRGPLLGEIPSVTIYASALLYSALLVVLSGLLFSRVRGRIAFWV
jgi:ABC-type polysaccharide/polyol phosphate export permease